MVLERRDMGVVADQVRRDIALIKRVFSGSSQEEMLRLYWSRLPSEYKESHDAEAQVAGQEATRQDAGG